ncbi:unnamed protein product [Polarella glacialis]|uniref:Uncharacterized protein n=1 Tax=Polarella glacialis TaxID=89957 RepID=A0A813JZ16_POLGL|nr:unnamed protein product [Polarella glacialis]
MAPNSDVAVVAEPSTLSAVSDERANLWKVEGNSRLTAGDDAGALDSYTRGIEAASQAGISGKLLSQLHTNRAQAHIRLGSFAEALKDSEVAFASDPSNGKAYWRGATAALRLDNAEEAAAICMRGIRAVGDSAGLAGLLEDARSRLSQGGEPQRCKDPEVCDNAPSVAQELADRAAGLLEIYLQADSACRSDDDARRSMRLFQACLKEDPNNESALIGLGDIFEDGLGGAVQDSTAAKQLWLQAAKAGSQRAQMKLCLQALGSWSVTTRQQALHVPLSGHADPSLTSDSLD